MKAATKAVPIAFSGTASGGSGTAQLFVVLWRWQHRVSGTLTPSHTYALYGSYTATLTVTDSAGHTAQSSTMVTVNDVAPTVNIGGPYSGTASTAISFAGSASTPSSQETATLKYSWNFGDGATSTQQKPSHAYASTGSYTVSLTVTDAAGLSTAASTTATVTAASASTEPLLHQNNFQYLGAFRVPEASFPGGGSSDNLMYNGEDLAFNPANNSLFMVGNNNDIVNISIPTLVNSSNISALNTASLLQWMSSPIRELQNNPTGRQQYWRLDGLQQ